MFVFVFVLHCILHQREKANLQKKKKMADTDNPDIFANDDKFTDDDRFAEEIVETGVIRKTVKRSYIIKEVSKEKKKTNKLCLYY